MSVGFFLQTLPSALSMTVATTDEWRPVRVGNRSNVARPGVATEQLAVRARHELKALVGLLRLPARCGRDVFVATVRLLLLSHDITASVDLPSWGSIEIALCLLRL